MQVKRWASLAGALLLAACSDEPTSNRESTTATSATDLPSPVEIKDVAQLKGDAEAGRVAFSQCRSCHTLEAGVHRVGPSLHGVVGRPIGKAADYRYSAAMAAAGGQWDDQTLFDFLETPREHIPGNKMSFVGVRDDQRRADLIAYLKTETD